MIQVKALRKPLRPMRTVKQSRIGPPPLPDLLADYPLEPWELEGRKSSQRARGMRREEIMTRLENCFSKFARLMKTIERQNFLVNLGEAVFWGEAYDKVVKVMNLGEKIQYFKLLYLSMPVKVKLSFIKGTVKFANAPGLSALWSKAFKLCYRGQRGN